MEKPILFNTVMVKAILDGKKTVTRRIIKNKYFNTTIELFENKHGKRLVYMQNDTPEDIVNEDGSRTCHLKACETIKKPYEIGDILYVRETWQETLNTEKDELEPIHYEQMLRENVEYTDENDEPLKWKPSIHMPKKYARIFLKVTSVRAERLQDMKYEDFNKEGFEISYEFMELWDSTLRKEDVKNYGYKANPWVWVIQFERVEECGL